MGVDGHPYEGHGHAPEGVHNHPGGGQVPQDCAERDACVPLDVRGHVRGPPNSPAEVPRPATHAEGWAQNVRAVARPFWEHHLRPEVGGSHAP